MGASGKATDLGAPSNVTRCLALARRSRSLPRVSESSGDQSLKLWGRRALRQAAISTDSTTGAPSISFTRPTRFGPSDLGYVMMVIPVVAMTITMVAPKPVVAIMMAEVAVVVMIAWIVTCRDRYRRECPE